MSDRAAPPHAQLLIYGFGPDADFEGRLAGALERIEAGGAMRVLDAVFVGREADTGELAAVSLRGKGAGGLAGPLIGFRLDAGERRRATERALRGMGGGLTPETLQELGGQLEPGESIVALLVDHAWARALDDAVERTGGEALVSEFVDAAGIADVAPAVLAAAASRSGP